MSDAAWKRFRSGKRILGKGERALPGFSSNALAGGHVPSGGLFAVRVFG